MPTSRYFRLFVFVLSILFITFTACKKNDSPADYNSDKAQLTKIIDSLTAVYNAAEEGSKPGKYAVGAKANLKAALDLAAAVANGNVYTQQQIDNSLANLLRSALEFNSKIIQEVSAENLVAQYKFDGDASDATGHNHNGTPLSGLIGPGSAPVDGGTLPLLIADRFGRANMAYDFTNGAYVEVPYDMSLNPKEFTFSLWIKHHVSSCDNYMMSLNRWNGYKFQLQCNDFAFLTFQGDNGYHDVDNNPGAVPVDVWTQVVVSYTTGTMKFYVNGSLVKNADITGTPLTLTTPVPLAIGQQLPKSIYNSSAGGEYDYYGPAFFNGSMDDIRIYNRALTDAEVLSIYTVEKDL